MYATLSVIDYECLASSLNPTIHWSAIPLRSWSFLNLFRIAEEAWSWCQILVHARFQLRVGYAPVTILSRAGYDYAALLSRFCGASFPWRFYYDPTKTMKIRLRLVYADGDAVATLLRTMRWSYAFVVILVPFLYKIDS